jgi:uncharacterized protein (TIGR03067 family)
MMQGSWKVTAAQVGKKKAGPNDLKGLGVIVDGDKFTLIEGKKSEVVHFVLDSISNPHRVDFFKGADKKEKVYHGLYTFSGGDLKLCWGPAQADRPIDFTTSASDHHRLYTLVKKK